MEKSAGAALQESNAILPGSVEAAGKEEPLLPNDSDVTLVATLSMDRLQMVEQLLLHWDGENKSMSNY